MVYSQRRFRNVLTAFILIFVSAQVHGVPISQDTAVARALEWMAGNPVMSKASQAVASVETFPDSGSYSVYVVQLAPKGFVILNSDDRLPLTVSFSAESAVNLSDDPQNALRAMLLDYCARMANELANWTPEQSSMMTMAVSATAEDELYGPFLETSWNQSAPYNNLCPSGTPSGCVPTTFAQLMNYHRWPYHGIGSRSYTDSSGSVTGSHSADYNDTYDWDHMLAAHSSGDPQVNQDAVSELMYELGVAAGVDYETAGTSGNSTMLASSLGEYCYYESSETHESQAELIAPMEADLRAGFPCAVSYPGHAFIADGLMVDSGATTYHFNMGWGGYNNGWYTKDAAPTGGGSAALNGGITSFRPQLMAFPQTNAVSGAAGGSAEVRWILPKRREGEVSKLTIKQLVQQAGNWQSDASEITGMSSGWQVVSGGHSGDCWYGGTYGTFSMVLKEVFVPDASTQLTFWMDYLLYQDLFTISVSTDGGATYADVFTVENRGYRHWSQESVSLAAYAGQEIRIKFSLRIGGTYYTSGGVWLDDLSVTTGDWYDWEPFAEDTTLASRRFSEVTTVWDEGADFSGFEVTSTSTYKDWQISTNGGVENCFYKQPGGYSNREYHLTSYSTITPTSATRLLLHAKYDLASDQFRVLVSTDRSSFTEVWSSSGSADWSDIPIELVDYAGQAIYVRLEYVVASYYVNGGVWIDSISTQEVTNPELEGQPIHYTSLSNLTVGTYTLAAALTDTNAVEHMVGPAFSLTIGGPADDGDGMPADWENLYGLDPNVDDGGLDPDHDGYNNYEEYVCGTIPTNPASCWMLESGDNGLPTFYSMTSRLYTVEYRTNLLSGSWIPLVADIPGTNGILSVSDYDSATNSARFYRVDVRCQE